MCKKLSRMKRKQRKSGKDIRYTHVRLQRLTRNGVSIIVDEEMKENVVWVKYKLAKIRDNRSKDFQNVWCMKEEDNNVRLSFEDMKR